MKSHRSERRYITCISVRASSAESLIDMMRYDSCFPSTEEDAHKIARLMSTDTPSNPDDHIINLTCVGRNDLTPTLGRWRSFNCTVIDVRHPDAEMPTVEELKRRLAMGTAYQQVMGARP